SIEQSRPLGCANPKRAVRIWQHTSHDAVWQSLRETERTPAPLLKRSKMESEIRERLLRIEIDELAVEQRHGAAMCHRQEFVSTRGGVAEKAEGTIPARRRH